MTRNLTALHWGALPVVLFVLSACGEEGSSGWAAGAPSLGGARSSGGAGGSNGGATSSGGTSSTPGGTTSVAGSTAVQPGVDPWDSKPDRGVVKDPGRYVATEDGAGRFPLVSNRKAVPIVMSGKDFWGVQRTAGDLKADIERVTDVEPELVSDTPPSGAKDIVLVGTLGKSPLIDQLVKDKKLDVSDIEGRWETFLIQVVQKPMANVDRALVITGSDQRGTSFGIYDLSKQIGVSPWYYWDDVPARKSSALYVLPGHHTMGEPAVKYRGLFINDENPQLGTWAYNTFGASPNASFPQAFHKKMYEKVFEVMLRIKANYLWPAVWGRAFAEDDPENHATAKAYGIVMGTSHEAPMMRGIEEWNRHAVPEVSDASGVVTTQGMDPYGGNGLWRFSKNPNALKGYWTDGIKRMVKEDFEGVITLGMRGPGDVSLPVEDGIGLMNNVIKEQRAIIAAETGKDVTALPQVWTLYKEVQDYWDKGMRVPDDVTVVWCDDNWGNMRELPLQTEPKRWGGYGLYYHFDYVGGGRNYKWVDTNLLPNVWEQLNLSYSYGVNRLWMVNVGDMKNEEHPLEFFMDYAWSPERWPLESLPQWERQWAAQQFGEEYSVAIADVLHAYSKLQSRRKPELTNRSITLDPAKNISDPGQTADAVKYDDKASPFSLTNYRELERMVEDWNQLASEAVTIGESLPKEARDAYFQLVLYQVQASAELYNHRLAVFKGLLYKAQGRWSTNDQGAKAQEFFDKGTALAKMYNETIAGGKWKGWQTQPYIGYGDTERYGSNASWQQPEKDNAALPDAPYPQIVTDFMVTDGKDVGVTVDGSDQVWTAKTPAETPPASLPTFSRYQVQPTQYIEVFRTGSGTDEVPFSITAPAEATWLTITPSTGTLNATQKDARIEVKVDWTKAPAEAQTVKLTVATGASSSRTTVTTVNAVIDPKLVPETFSGFVEANGYVSLEADHFSRIIDGPSVGFRKLPEIGRTGSGMTPFPVTAAAQKPGGTSPHLEYDVYLGTGGDITVWTFCSPRNNVLHGDGLKYAISIDDAEPQIVNITTALNGIPMNKSWERNTSDNVNRTSVALKGVTPGAHVLKLWMVDPTVVVQKLVVDTGGLKPSYLGPLESHRITR
ncbi:MAG TPA: glycosyl hydrolase 115 family protein [Polyangiaceae bacterium]|nr:glycosyl hydrolase 115 family protein [Polyangiaceae bacterium]